MTGKFEMAKLLPGIAYEIILILNFGNDGYEWEQVGLFKITLPTGGEILQYEREVLINNKSRGKWTEILVAEFKREADNQVGQLEFFLSLDIRCMSIKGVLIRLKP